MTEQNFKINRIYVKESSYIAKGLPELFKAHGNSKNEMELKLAHQKLQEEGYYEVTLDIVVKTKVAASDQDKSETVEVDTKDKEAKAEKEVLEVKIKQSGIFQIEGFEKPQLDKLLGGYCPEILYPYARHAIAELSVIGSLPPITLTPMNFQSLYEQSKKRAEEQRQETRH